MSSFKKNTLAAALVLGMGLAGGVAAYTYTTAGNAVPEKVANFAFNGTTAQTYTMTEAVEFNVEAQDLILGRTTGFTVRFALDNAQFGAAVPVPTLGPALPPGKWSVTVVAGGTVGSNFVVFNVTPIEPVSADSGVKPGTLFSLNGLTLRNVEELATTGGKITGFAFLADAVTTTELPNSRKAITLLESGNPLTRACDIDAGDVAKRIDVADTSTAGGFKPKQAFSATGSIGGAALSGPEASEFDFGDYKVGVDPAFAFTYLPTDEFVTTLSGPNSFASFTDIYLSTDDCATNLVDGDIAGNKVTFEYTLADVGGTPAGFTVSVCGTIDNTKVLLDNNPISISTVATRGANDVNLPGCALLPLQYNGSIVRVYNINPAGNAQAQSFLRVINPSDAPGRVTIVAWDDNGNFRGPVRFTLNAKNSRQLNSEHLENGGLAWANGTLGDGTGKWRLEVTGEFPGMRVQSLNRNVNDGTVTNLTDADGHGEQAWEAVWDNQ